MYLCYIILVVISKQYDGIDQKFIRFTYLCYQAYVFDDILPYTALTTVGTKKSKFKNKFNDTHAIICVYIYDNYYYLYI